MTRLIAYPALRRCALHPEGTRNPIDDIDLGALKLLDATKGVTGLDCKITVALITLARGLTQVRNAERVGLVLPGPHHGIETIPSLLRP